MAIAVRELKLSFIIPTLNEQNNIGTLIDSIHESIRIHEFEIIIVDNGSSDDTEEIAINLGAKVLSYPKVTIATLRNKGVQKSSGEILIFLDADVTLGPNWEHTLNAFLVTSKTPFITGSTCTSPNRNNFLTKYWFDLLKCTSSKYINSGHLITSRDVFDTIGGFKDDLITSEDVDFCNRAQRAGAKIINNSDMIAYHHGYPKRLKGFILREAWHGRQDFSNIKSILNSKTTSISIINSTILALGLILSAVTTSLLPALAGVILSQSLCLLLSYRKFGAIDFKHNLNASLCFQAYLFGRTLSPFLNISSPRKR